MLSRQRVDRRCRPIEASSRQPRLVGEPLRSYYVFGGHEQGVTSARDAGALAGWSAILDAKAAGKEALDFEGSMAPAIERFFRGFGPTLHTAHSIRRAPFFVELALKQSHRGAW